MANYIHVPPGSPEVPKLDIALSDVDGPGCRDGALQLLRRLRPHWSPEEVTLQASCLTDGDAVPSRQHINRVGVFQSPCDDPTGSIEFSINFVCVAEA